MSYTLMAPARARVLYVLLVGIVGIVGAVSGTARLRAYRQSAA